MSNNNNKNKNTNISKNKNTNITKNTNISKNKNISKNMNKNFNKKKRGGGKTICRVVSEIMFVLIAVEFLAYRSLTWPEDMEGKDNNFETQQQLERMHRLVTPQAHRRQQKQKQQQQSSSTTTTTTAANKTTITATQQQQQHGNINDNDNSHIAAERQKTVDKLKQMGITIPIPITTTEDSDNNNNFKQQGIPPWSQIIDNFNPVSQDDEPIILGLEYCEDFRNSFSPKDIGVAPAGMFSSGTNLIASLMRNNCLGPGRSSARDRKKTRFAYIQVPWGKHNPAYARYHHQVQTPVVKNREAILPIVAIRHPYTWMSAMCKHSYATRWNHDKNKCHESLYLKNPILKVPYGFKNFTDAVDTNITHNVTNSYKSLAHMWKEWYTPYFLDKKYNQTPRLMVRHEDMVYRPEKVINKICECVGGQTRRNHSSSSSSSNSTSGFQYEEESANRGKGHGKQGRSGLLTAVIKYGQPLQNWYDEYSASDRKIMKSVFQQDEDKDGEAAAVAIQNIFDTFQYKLFDDTNEPSHMDKMRTRKRIYEESRQ